MKVLIITNFANDFSGASNGRFAYLADALADSCTVEIVTSDFRHRTKEHSTQKPDDLKFKVTFLHEPGYRKNISVRRFLSHRQWGKAVAEYLKTVEKPDVIYCAVPSLTAAAEAAAYCRKNQVRFLVDIQDLWPEAFYMALNIPVVSRALFHPFKKTADCAYSAADEIVAVSKTYAERAMAVNGKCREPKVVFLGTKLETFDENAAENPPILCKKDGELWLGYIGTLGACYDLPCVIRALAILKESGSRVPTFIVMGQGERQAEFENLTKECGVEAVFTGRLPYPEMCGLLKSCDLVVNPIAHGAAQSIINKHGDYAASGLPVINTQECPEYRELIDEYQMGLNCENANAEDVAEKLKLLCVDPDLRLSMGKNARRCAEERFDRKNCYQAIVKCIMNKA